MLYELINPSDKTHFDAPDLLIATLVTLVLGGGQYGAEPIDEDAEDVPIFLFGGVDTWWREHFPDEPTEIKEAIDRHAVRLTAALRTVAYGSPDDRKLYDSALAAIDDPDKKAAFIAEWNEVNRSSLNNIMDRAHAIAEDLDKAATMTAPPCVVVAP